MQEKYKIAIAGTGYVGLSMATLLAQHNKVLAVDIVPEKVDMINKGISPKRIAFIDCIALLHTIGAAVLYILLFEL